MNKSAAESGASGQHGGRLEAAMTSYNGCDDKGRSVRDVRGAVSDHALELPDAKMIPYPSRSPDGRPGNRGRARARRAHGRPRTP